MVAHQFFSYTKTQFGKPSRAGVGFFVARLPAGPLKFEHVIWNEDDFQKRFDALRRLGDSFGVLEGRLREVRNIDLSKLVADALASTIAGSAQLTAEATVVSPPPPELQHSATPNAKRRTSPRTQKGPGGKV